MNKSVYSLVLSDDVVAAVDKMAYRAGMSRSAFINGVLAEAVSYVTPEKRMSDIFTEIEKLLSGGSFLIQPQPSDAMLSIRSAMQYKYKPVIRYSLELYRTFEKTIGTLKVSFRTQSERLRSQLEDFLKVWIALENRYIVGYFPEGITYTIENGRFTRTFCVPPDKKDFTNDEIARTISDYIRMFDEILKIYFAGIESGGPAQLAEKRYREYAEKGIVII